MPSRAACAVTSETRNTGRSVVRQTVILSYLGTFAGVHGTALQHDGYIHDEALCVQDLRPNEPLRECIAATRTWRCGRRQIRTERG
jgi:hypothetical protein